MGCCVREITAFRKNKKFRFAWHDCAITEYMQCRMMIGVLLTAKSTTWPRRWLPRATSVTRSSGRSGEYGSLTQSVKERMVKVLWGRKTMQIVRKSGREIRRGQEWLAGNLNERMTAYQDPE